MARQREIVFDSLQPAALARFWAQVLDGYAVMAYDAAELAKLAAQGLTPETDPAVLVQGPGPLLCFQRAMEPKVTRNRVHLDVTVADRAREVRRLLALGATLAREADTYTVLRDPEGNEFCVTERP